jgi:hypothetical protein
MSRNEVKDEYIAAGIREQIFQLKEVLTRMYNSQDVSSQEFAKIERIENQIRRLRRQLHSTTLT